MLGALKTSVESSALAATTRYQRFFGPGDYGPVAYRFTGHGNLAIDTVSGRYTTQAGLAGAMFGQLLTTATLLSDNTKANDTAVPGTADATKLHPSHGAPKPTPELRLRPRV